MEATKRVDCSGLFEIKSAREIELMDDWIVRMRHVLGKPALGIADTFRVGRRREMGWQTGVSLQRTRCCEEPGFVFPVGKKYLNTYIGPDALGAAKYLGAQGGGAIIFAIEQNQDMAIRLRSFRRGKRNLLTKVVAIVQE